METPEPQPTPDMGTSAERRITKRFWSIQNMLLLLGAVMLGGASIVFLVFSWGQMDLGPRALVVGGFTVVLFFSAWLTTRKGLRASGEAISGLAALTLYLDAWALRATDIIVWGTANDYLAAMTVTTGAILIAVGIFIRLVTPRIVGTALVPLGALALATGQDSGLSATIVLVLGAAVGLAMFHPRADRMTSIALTVSTTLLMLFTPFAFLAAWIADGAWAGAISLTCVAIVLGLFAWLSPRWRQLLAVLTATAVTGAGLLYGLGAVSGRPALPSWFSVESVAVALPILGAVIATFVVVGIVRLTSNVEHRGIHSIAVRTSVVLNAAFIAPILFVLAFAILNEPIGQNSGGIPWPAHLLAAVIVFAAGTAILRLRGIDSKATQPLAVYAVVISVAALPAVIPGTFTAFALWLAFSIGAAMIIAVVNPKGLTRVPLRALIWASLLPAFLYALVIPTNYFDSGTDTVIAATLIGAFFLTLSIIFFAMRSWERCLRVATPHHGAIPMLAVYPQAGNVPMVRPMAPQMVYEKRYKAASSIARTALLAVSIIMAYVGLTAIIAGQLTHISQASALVALPLLALSLVVLIRTTAARSSFSSDAKAILVSAAGIAILLLPALALNPQATSAEWVKHLGVALSVLILAHASVFILSARTRLPSQDNARTYAAGLVPVAVLVLIRSVTTFDQAGSIEWSLIALGVLAVTPTVVGGTLHRTESRRQALEYTTLIAGILVTLTLLADSRTLGFAFLIAAAGAFILSATRYRKQAVWFGYGLTIVSSWLLSANYNLDFVEVYTVPVALLICALGQATIRAGRSHFVLLTGIALLTLPTVFQTWQETTSWRIWAMVTVSALIAFLLTVTKVVPPPQKSSGWPLLRDIGLLNLVILFLGPLPTAIQHSQNVEFPETLLWTALAATLAGLTCLGLNTAARWPNSWNPAIWGPGLVLTIVTLPFSVLLLRDAFMTSSATLAAVLLTAAWGGLALLGTPPGWPPVRSNHQFRARAIAPLVISIVVAVTLAPAVSIPADVLLTIAGLFVALVGIRAAFLTKHVSTWSNVSFGVIATVAPLSLAMLNDPTGWRVALAVLIASAWLLSGVRLQWQAPVVLGALALLAQVLVLAGPPALAAFAGLQGWAVLAIVGTVLLLAGLLYERQAARAKSAIKKLSDLR